MYSKGSIFIHMKLGGVETASLDEYSGDDDDDDAVQHKIILQRLVGTADNHVEQEKYNSQRCLTKEQAYETIESASEGGERPAEKFEQNYLEVALIEICYLWLTL